MIHKCLNLLGKYLSSQFESRKMGGGGCPAVKSRDEVRFRLRVRSEGGFVGNETALILGGPMRLFSRPTNHLVFL